MVMLRLLLRYPKTHILILTLLFIYYRDSKRFWNLDGNSFSIPHSRLLFDNVFFFSISLYCFMFINLDLDKHSERLNKTELAYTGLLSYYRDFQLQWISRLKYTKSSTSLLSPALLSEILLYPFVLQPTIFVCKFSIANSYSFSSLFSLSLSKISDLLFIKM